VLLKFKVRSVIRWTSSLTLVVGLMVPGMALAQQPTIGGGKWYYDIGGSLPISPPPNPGAVALGFDPSVNLQLPRACGDLDVNIAISNVLGQVSDGLDQLDELLVLAATEAIAALPALILQRANPGLYEHLQNALSKAQQVYDVAVASCERIVEESANGRNPWADWVTIAKRENYQEEIDGDDADAIQAEDNVAETNGDDGVGWIGGEKKGGLNQDPIEVNFDVVQAGYNVIVGQDVTAETGPPAAEGLRIVELFETPVEAAQFAVDVLGDVTIFTCGGCTPTSTAGVGLGTSFAVENEAINEQLTGLANNDEPVSLEILSEVSAASVSVTPALLETLRDVDDEQTRVVLTARLAGDVATARIVERALSIRRALYSGRRVPEVAANDLAKSAIDESLAELEQEIEGFLFESRIQEELLSNTASIILEEGNRLKRAAAGLVAGPQGEQGGVLLRGENRNE